MPHDRPDDARGVAPGAFRLLVVPGVNPAKWLTVWQQRLPHVPVTLVHATAAEQEDALRRGDADAGLVRLPVDRSDLSAIPLYTETTVVVVPRDHLVTAADEVSAADLTEETLLVPEDDVVPWPSRPGEPSALPTLPTTAAAVELVAAGVGVLVVPQSLARLHHRRDVTFRPVTDAPTSSVGLAWVTDAHTDLVEELIGIVRGRTANSSRGRSTGAAVTRTPEAGPGGTADRGRAERAGTDRGRGRTERGRTEQGRTERGRRGPGKRGGAGGTR